MPVVRPPSRRSLAVRIGQPLALLGVAIGLIVFLYYRFSETPVERAERLYQKHDFPALKKHARAQKQKGDQVQLFLSYEAVATFATEPQTRLAALMQAIAAADARPIFRRETLLRIVESGIVADRGGELIAEACKIENPPGAELRHLIGELIKTSQPLRGEDTVAGKLFELFPALQRKVKAKRLQMRSGPSTDAAVVRQLDDNEMLLMRNSLGMTNVSGRTGRWTFVIDKNMQSGWVFDAYLVSNDE